MQKDCEKKRCQRVNLTLPVVKIFAFVLLFNKYTSLLPHHCCLLNSISIYVYTVFFFIHSNKIQCPNILERTKAVNGNNL